MENTRKPPRLIFKGLHILDFDAEYIARFGALDFEGSREIMHFGEINIQHVVGGVVVADLSACPVEAFDFDGFVVADGAAEGDYVVSSNIQLAGLDV